MKSFHHIAIAMICTMTAASSLLVSLPMALCAFTPNSPMAAAQTPIEPSCTFSCCDQNAGGCNCCAKPVAQSRPNSSSAVSCACSQPTDSVPPTMPARSLTWNDGFSVALVTDRPQMAGQPGQVTRFTHHPPVPHDLLITFSRLTC